MTYPFTARSRCTAKGKNTGFALVVALVLMGLLVSLVLLLATLVQTEVTVYRVDTLRMQARQNALFALQEAVAQLQATAGPDQRVSARADIAAEIDKLGDNVLGFKPVANPYYTLVWDVSGAQGQAPGAVPGHDAKRKPHVLVSGNAKLGFDPVADAAYPAGYTSGETEFTAGDSSVVTLADYSDAASGESFAVKVPRVELGQEQGSYAWWVGDENVKARLNLNATRTGTDNADAAWLAPQRFAPQLNVLLGLATAGQLERVGQIGDLGLEVLTPDQMEKGGIVLQRDYSTVSRSLLADVRNGGLKKDLSYGLDNANTAPTQIENENYLFARDLGGAPADLSYNMNFAQWGVLRDYYNTRVGDTDVTTSASRVPSARGAENYETGVRPVISLFQLGVYADYVGEEIRFHYFPAVVLWNPYRFDISIPNLHLTFKQARGSNNINITRIEVEGDPGITNETFTLGYMSFTIPGGTIPAGKAVIYSPASGTHTFSPGKDTDNYGYKDPTTPNYLYPGFRQGASFTQMSGLRWTPPASGGGSGGEEDAVPELSFALQFNSRMHIDLARSNSENAPVLNETYQVVAGMPGNTRLGSSNQVQFYTPLPEGSYPEPKFLFVYGMPFAQEGFYGSTHGDRQWVGQFNPRAVVNVDDAVTFGYGDLRNYAGGFFVDSEAEANAAIQTASGGYGYVGTSAAFGGSDTAILFDLPRAPLHSLGQLAHAQLTAVPSSLNKEVIDLMPRPATTGWAGSVMQPKRLAFSGSGDDTASAYVVGNSRASPYIPLDGGSGDDERPYWRIFDRATSLGTTTAFSKMVWDFSYLANEALFDSYFFSTVPQSGTIGWPLRNPLLALVPGKDAQAADLRNFDRAASLLTVEGGFNVNSTSVEAWSAFLAALRNQPYDGKAGTGSVFARLFEPAGDQIAEGAVGPFEADSVTGFRRLTDEQIRDLAERIVEQVRVRGPFPSMAAFVNRVMYPQALYREGLDEEDAPDPRSLYGTSYTLEEMVMRQGALSAALEMASVNNGHYGSSNVVSSGSSLNGTASQRRNFYGSIGADLPGYLSQVDILSTLAPLMTVRSDTFVIRVYGAAAEPGSSAVAAEVYGEAVVQRMPEYVSTADAAWETATDAVNKALGRRFRLVSFRWLGPNELSN